jgi:hypothetical protein
MPNPPILDAGRLILILCKPKPFELQDNSDQDLEIDVFEEEAVARDEFMESVTGEAQRSKVRDVDAAEDGVQYLVGEGGKDRHPRYIQVH